MKSSMMKGSNKVMILLLIFVVSSCVALDYSNPIVPHSDNPDPGAIYVSAHDAYYVATTTGSASIAQFPIRMSKNLVHWSIVGWVFPSAKDWPVWAEDNFWAPEIHYVNDRFIVYFAARNKQGVLCVGAAHSEKVEGPFKDRGAPLISNVSMGNIDPTYYHDESTNQKFLIWKEDGNGHVPQVPTPIWAQQLTDDGLNSFGSWHFLIQNDARSWEGDLVEAPWIVQYNHTFYLFYSANDYASPAYAIGVAKATNLLGPYSKFAGNPIIMTDKYWSGPGHCSVLKVKNKGPQWFMIYHSWVGKEISNGYPRVLMLDSIEWKVTNGEVWPSIASRKPSYGPTPVPSL